MRHSKGTVWHVVSLLLSVSIVRSFISSPCLFKERWRTCCLLLLLPTNKIKKKWLKSYLWSYPHPLCFLLQVVNKNFKNHRIVIVVSLSIRTVRLLLYLTLIIVLLILLCRSLVSSSPDKPSCSGSWAIIFFFLFFSGVCFCLYSGLCWSHVSRADYWWTQTADSIFIQRVI